MKFAVKNVILYMDNWGCTVILLKIYMRYNSREHCLDCDRFGFKVRQNTLYFVEDSSHLRLGKCFLMFQRPWCFLHLQPRRFEPRLILL
jgi:hypothetical protein